MLVDMCDYHNKSSITCKNIQYTVRVKERENKQTTLIQKQINTQFSYGNWTRKSSLKNVKQTLHMSATNICIYHLVSY